MSSSLQILPTNDKNEPTWKLERVCQLYYDYNVHTITDAGAFHATCCFCYRCSIIHLQSLSEQRSVPTWALDQQVPFDIQFQMAQMLAAVGGKVLKRTELALSITGKFHCRPRCLHQVLECLAGQQKRTALTEIESRNDIKLQVFRNVWKSKEQLHASLASRTSCNLIIRLLLA